VTHVEDRSTSQGSISLISATVLSPCALSARDRIIIDLARSKLRDTRVEFGDALRALREAVEESIPGGRVFVLGSTSVGAIVGSLISGVGIVDGATGVELLYVRSGVVRRPLGRFAP
jgi:cytochrome c biogenesis protein CcdA